MITRKYIFCEFQGKKESDTAQWYVRARILHVYVLQHIHSYCKVKEYIRVLYLPCVKYLVEFGGVRVLLYTLGGVTNKEDIRSMERTLSMNYPVLGQNKRVLLYMFVKNSKISLCTLHLSIPSCLSY